MSKADELLVTVTPTERGFAPLDARDQLAAYLKAHAGQPVDIVLRPHRRQRSLVQNNWIWGVAYPLLAETLGYDADEIDDMHYGLVAKWAGSHIDERIGEVVANKRSSELTTKEFSDYMEWIVRFAAKELGCQIPLPDETPQGARVHYSAAR
jgi:hypothetical protein